jgi:CubicO group peptidase (beta-lactamase class C family)
MINKFPYLLLLLFLIPFSCADRHRELGGAMEAETSESSYNIPADSLSSDSVSLESALAKLDNYFSKRNKYQGFNGTVLYALEGQIVYSKAFGFADLRDKDSLSVESAFQLASVSKPITALAVLLLVEDGLLNLDDSVQTVFPEFPYEGISIRMLMSHRSGLPNYMYFADSLWPDWEVPITNRDVLNLMIEHKPERYYPPDKRYNYCNTNYALLALIVEEVSEMAFDLFVKTRIFLPLEMFNSQIYNKSTAPINFNDVTGYYSGRREAENTYLNGVVGDKGVYSSTIDLFKLDKALRGGDFISEELLAEAFKPQHQDLYVSDNYGLGWRIDDSDPQNKVVYHTGWWKGFRSYFIRELGSGKTIIVLSNTARSSSIGSRELRNLI